MDARVEGNSPPRGSGALIARDVPAGFVLRRHLTLVEADKRFIVARFARELYGSLAA